MLRDDTSGADVTSGVDVTNEVDVTNGVVVCCLVGFVDVTSCCLLFGVPCLVVVTSCLEFLVL